MKIAIGTKNPAKIKGVKRAIERIFENKDNIMESFSVESEISDQPMTNEETIKGAYNRAYNALIAMDSDLGIGLEGGCYDTEHGMFLTGWVVVIDKNKKYGVGGGCSLQLPEIVAKELRMGKELGPLMDQFTGEHNMNHKGGSIGFFTNGVVERSESFERSTIYALAKFMNPDYY